MHISTFDLQFINMKELSLAIILCFLPWSLIVGQSNEIKVDESGIQFGDGGQINGNTTSLTFPTSYKYIYAEFSNGITGDVTQAPYENQVDVYTIDHFQYTDINASNGYPLATTRNKYLTFRKPLDAASVDLAGYYKNNSFISSITFNLVQNDGAGLFINRFDIILENVKIVEQWLDFDIKQDGTYQVVEKFLVAYSTYTIKDVINNVETSINWNF